MFNKRNKKRGFTLIELIIVIAIIAILAAIAVPAFGKIREKANVSADIGNARTIYSLVATELASDAIQYGDGSNTVNDALTAVGDSKTVNIEEKIDPTPKVKAYQGATFVVTIKADGSIQVNIAKGSNSYENVYPKASGKYSETNGSYSSN